MSWLKQVSGDSRFKCRTDLNGDFLVILKEASSYAPSAWQSITVSAIDQQWELVAESSKEAVFKRKLDKESFEYKTAQVREETQLPA